jgi:hypothetical protein
MRVFNAFYYSFSPEVASFVTSHNSVRAGMKILLYPLVGILYVSSRVFAAASFSPEIAVTLSGVITALGIGAVYLGPILAILDRLFKLGPSSRLLRSIRVVFLFGIASLLGLLLAELGQAAALFEIATVCLVLSYVVLGGLVTSWLLARTYQHRPG